MSTKSMLVNFVGYPNEAFNLVPDNGLANLAACLKRAGHHTLIWDCATISMIDYLYPRSDKRELTRLGAEILRQMRSGEFVDKGMLDAYHAIEDQIDKYQDSRIRQLGREMARYTRDHRLDFVGFKLWTGIGFHGSIILAEEIKAVNPSIRVFGGGPHVDLFMERSFQVTNVFDILVCGEGEDVIVQLAEFVEGKRALRDVANALYVDNGQVVANRQTRVQDLDSLPLPCYDEDVYPAMHGDEKIKVILLDESRGCPNDCHFCVHPIKSGRSRRLTSATTFVDRLEQVIAKYGFCSFRFAGSNPPVGLRRSIASEIVRRNMDVSFSAFAHVRGSDIHDFQLLRKAGCKALAFGVESGSQKILDESMNKHVKVEDIRRALRQCKDAGIALAISVIIPAPHESEATKDETFELLSDLRPDSTYVSFPIMTLGAAWDREKERFGFELSDPDNFYYKAMTHHFNVFGPAALWRPLDGYSLNGKTFQQLFSETAQFVERLGSIGLCTQFFDQVFLMAELAGMPTADFARLSGKYISEGDTEEMRMLTRKVNLRVAERAAKWSHKQHPVLPMPS